MVMRFFGFVELLLGLHPLVKRPLASVAVAGFLVMSGRVSVPTNIGCLLGYFTGFESLLLMVMGGVLIHLDKLAPRPDGDGDKQHHHQRQQTGQVLRHTPNRDNPV